MSLHAASAAAQGALGTLALMAVQGTVLALLAVGLVRAGRLRPSWQAAIWLVVLVKFLLPWGPALPFSLADLFALARPSPGGYLLPATVAPAAVAPAGSPLAALGWLGLAGAWALTSLVLVIRAVLAQRRGIALARAARPAPAAVAAVLAAMVAERPGLRLRTPTLRIGAATTGPYVIGLVRPIIVVPPALLEAPALLRAALLHELAHVRRLDALGRAIQVLATALFPVWPVVHLASRRLELAREAACDAWALEAAELSRPQYARLLVQMAALRTPAAPALASPRALDARIALVLGAGARARLTWPHRLALLAWVAVALGGARPAAATAPEEVCRYTPAIAAALRDAHPEADRDGDGVVSRDEACELQAEFRRRAEAGEELVSRPDEAAAAELDRVLSEPLCCNCAAGDGVIPSSGGAPADVTCQ